MSDIPTTKHEILSVVQKDADGNVLSPGTPGYSAAAWSITDPSLASLATFSLGDPNHGNCDLIPSGLSGSATITATSSKAGAPTLIGTLDKTFIGPVAASLGIIEGPLLDK